MVMRWLGRGFRWDDSIGRGTPNARNCGQRGVSGGGHRPPLGVTGGIPRGTLLEKDLTAETISGGCTPDWISPDKYLSFGVGVGGGYPIQNSGAVQLHANRPANRLPGNRWQQTGGFDFEPMQNMGVKGNRIAGRSTSPPVVATELQSVAGEILDEDKIPGLGGTRNNQRVAPGLAGGKQDQ